MSRMFQVEGKTVLTWNPIGGECAYLCFWCWARRLIQQKVMEKYQGEPFLVENAFEKKFKPGDVVAVQLMSDLFSPKVPDIILNEIMHYISQFPETTFLFLTKNPQRYLAMQVLPLNCIFGVTIETDMDFLNPSLYAPSRFDRFYWIVLLKRLNPEVRAFVSIEPIMAFTTAFLCWIKLIAPLFVYLGYDNYASGLTEPDLTQTYNFVEELSNFTDVRPKTLREAKKQNDFQYGKRLEEYF